jgi:hypothetical protein
MNSQSSLMPSLPSPAPQLQCGDLSSRSIMSAEPKRPFSNDMLNVKSNAGRSGWHTTRELYAKKRQLRPEIAREPIAQHLSKDFKLRRTSELLLGEPAREKASQPELDIEELDALPSGSLGYEV